MIEIGDLVRIRNSALKSSLFRRTRGFKRFRLKQVIARVTAIEENYDWRNRHLNRIVTLDVLDPGHFYRGQWKLSSDWLVVHRKHKNPVICNNTNGAVTVSRSRYTQ